MPSFSCSDCLIVRTCGGRSSRSSSSSSSSSKDATFEKKKKHKKKKKKLGASVTSCESLRVCRTAPTKVHKGRPDGSSSQQPRRQQQQPLSSSSSSSNGAHVKERSTQRTGGGRAAIHIDAWDPGRLSLGAALSNTTSDDAARHTSSVGSSVIACLRP
eukprot:CAMPEP_0185690292 /NCGR_PEP_ID=MMETSP1164-20130828/1016_1 /TAXON_ID=1104430 /ORGANISM="Chrysoreinhardia sp, Strain CCMP2950" /LENGTH=157 /DNA_ID=CAMNT_0028356849 /DNA_START=1 /DNA_END=471 /DNA_ORIENTATION=-